MFKAFWDRCCMVWDSVDEKLFRRFLYLPISIIVTSVAVLGVLWIEYEFDLAHKNDFLPTSIEKVSADDIPEETVKTVGVKVEKMKAGDKPIDINTALTEELQRLPGIGAVRAFAIVKQREKMGGFQTVDDIKCTPGIGEKVFKGISEFIKIDN